MTIQTGSMCRFLSAGVLGMLALADAAQAGHVVDGAFGPLEWTLSATDGTPAPPNVSHAAFTVGGVTNAAHLYAAQYDSSGTPVTASLGSKLGLMYDCTICGAPLPANAALDIFFTSGPDDYAVHVFSASGVPAFLAFEKPVGTVSSLNLDGSLNLADPVWSALDAADLALAQFVVAVGFGPSPNAAADHYFVEFELSVNSNGPGLPPNGLYSPDPAFWSASTSGEQGFPSGPISSGTFTLHADGSTTVQPLVGPNGEPVLQPVPEPGGLALSMLGIGLGACLTKRQKGRRALR